MKFSSEEAGMRFSFSAEEREFREMIRDWLYLHRPRTPRPVMGEAMKAFDLDWQRRKYEGGWGAISWPKAYGGAGLSLIQQMIWYEEAARAGAPGVGCLSIALGHAGPTVMSLGDEAQKTFHLPKILRGEVVWCQGFSEPNAGSDLGSLRTRAVIDGDALVVNGHKIWTSHAQHATYQEMLVRTDPGLGKHKGITWVICDMRSPGITIRPIDTMAGDQHYCEVFYDDVRIPLTNVVGDVNDGWKVAMATLTSERGGAAASLASEAGEVIERLAALAASRSGPDGRPVIRNEEIASRIARHRAEAAALRSMTYANISRAIRGEAAGPEGVMAYLYFGELLQRVRITALDVLGADCVEMDGEAEGWTRPFLADRMFVIAGGSAEVRRNIIAERLLGLPRSY
jgi:alkylation response protein AidB-like acyl-CoA dehydrogenase